MCFFNIKALKRDVLQLQSNFNVTEIQQHELIPPDV